MDRSTVIAWACFAVFAAVVGLLSMQRTEHELRMQEHEATMEHLGNCQTLINLGKLKAAERCLGM